MPLRSRPQTFRVSLGGTPYSCRLTWNVPGQFWVLDIASNIDEPIISGIPLVTGCDLLEQFEFANIRGRLFVMSVHGPPDDIPGFRDLGTRSHLYFLPWDQPWDTPGAGSPTSQYIGGPPQPPPSLNRRWDVVGNVAGTTWDNGTTTWRD